MNSRSGGAIAEAVATADAMDLLRVSFNDDVMAPFMKLMNTKLGFMTDRDPSKFKSKNAQGQPLDYKGNIITPYPVEVVRECVIEACLRGLRVVGNQFNIISGGCYTTREGYAYLIKQLDGLKNYTPVVGIPKKGDVGTFCQCKAKWTIGTKEDSLGYDEPINIPVKVDDYTTADAVIGKATRKFYKRVYEKMTGVEMPDGEVGDDIIPPHVDVKTAKTDAPGTAHVQTEAELPKGGKTIDSVRKLIAGSTVKVTEEQILAFLKTVKKVRLDVETLEDVAPIILGEVVSNWSTLLPEIQLVEV